MAEAYQDLLKEIVEKKKLEAEIRARPPKPKTGTVAKAWAAVILPPIAALVWIFNPFAPGPEPLPPMRDDIATYQTALLGAALAIKDWRDSTGHLPVDLAAAGMPEAGFSYQVDGENAFTLRSYSQQGIAQVWVSGDSIGYGSRPAAPIPPPAPLFPP